MTRRITRIVRDDGSASELHRLTEAATQADVLRQSLAEGWKIVCSVLLHPDKPGRSRLVPAIDIRGVDAGEELAALLERQAQTVRAQMEQERSETDGQDNTNQAE